MSIRVRLLLLILFATLIPALLAGIAVLQVADKPLGLLIPGRFLAASRSTGPVEAVRTGSAAARGGRPR